MNVKKYQLWMLLAFGFSMMVPTVSAQQKIGYVNSDIILQAMPNYATIQQQMDRMAADWQKELDQLKKDLDEQFRDYQARELLYTNEERLRRRSEIVSAEDDLERLRVKYFGPEGDIFLEQEKLMRPLQEKILQAIDDVATAEGYDYVFDVAGDFLFMFRRPQFDLSENVLLELGIDVASTGRQTSQSN
ncbi:MAG: OmpH family outer membrane protein [Bacteroidetes bacterium]|nr:OmpH family outer membrane protein [Bacteroidota bacterium]